MEEGSAIAKTIRITTDCLTRNTGRCGYKLNSITRCVGSGFS